MRAPLSIIVPTCNSADQLPRCLTALGEGLDAGLIRELIFADAGSQDDTLAIAEAAGADVVAAKGTTQLSQGLEAAQGAWVLCLEPETRLGAGWATEAQSVLARPGIYGFRAQPEGAGRFTRSLALCLSWWYGPRIAQGMLIERQYVGALEQIESAKARLPLRVRGQFRYLNVPSFIG